MEVITSTANAKIKFFKTLHDKSTRRELGMVLLEGESLINDIDCTKVTISAILSTEEKSDMVADIVKQSGAVHYIINEKVADYLTSLKTSPGVFAVASTNIAVDKNLSVAVILDGIKDPGNLGTIIRTCTALGVTEIYGVDCVDFWNEKVIRASMGGVYNVNFHTASMQSIKELAKEYQLYKLDMAGENIFAQSGFLSKKNSKIALAIGSEAHGLSEDIRNIPGKVVSLPMPGNMESLNAGVAFSVALYTMFYS